MSYPSGYTYATLFLLLVVATVVTLIADAALAMRGRVGRLLRRLLLSAVVYLAIVIVASARSVPLYDSWSGEPVFGL